MGLSLSNLRREVQDYRNPEKAKIFQKYFKTAKGEYGEGDIFYGLSVPQSRRIAGRYGSLSLGDIEQLLASRVHEERIIALLLFVSRFQKGTSAEQKKIYDMYLRNTRYINNWDLVDVSARDIVGAYLFHKDMKPLRILARSKNLWERRIAIIATLYFIQRNSFAETLRIAEILLNDKHDLIHKAVGWMLREVGKRSRKAEESFLARHSKSMPRTMLRYALEHFSKAQRKKYMASGKYK